MSFGQNVAATKIELFKYKKSSQVAVMVQGILDDKRKVLLKNIEEMIEEASKARGKIQNQCLMDLQTQILQLIEQQNKSKN